MTSSVIYTVIKFFSLTCNWSIPRQSNCHTCGMRMSLAKHFVNHLLDSVGINSDFFYI